MKRKLTLTGIFLIGALLCGTLFWAGPCLANPPAHFCGGCSMEQDKLYSKADSFCKSNYGICAKAVYVTLPPGQRPPYYSAGVCVQDFFIVCMKCGDDYSYFEHSFSFTADECGWDY